MGGSMTFKGSLDDPPIVVRGSRTKAGLVFVGALAFVGLGVLMLKQSTDLLAYLCIGFFGLCAIVGLFQFVVPNVLELSPAGLSWRAKGRRHSRLWSDIDEFRVVGMISSRYVGWNYTETFSGRAQLGALNAGLVGVEATLPVGWELDPPELADLLNRARSKWLVRASGAGAEQSSGSEVTSGGSILASRMGRRGYWIWLAVLVGISVAVGLTSGGAKASSGGLLLPMIWAYRGRLHDIGHTAWLALIPVLLPVVAVIVGLLMTGASEGVDSEPVLLLAFALQAIPTAIIGLIPGTPGPNRFGPAPGRPRVAAKSAR